MKINAIETLVLLTLPMVFTVLIHAMGIKFCSPAGVSMVVLAGVITAAAMRHVGTWDKD